MYKPSTSKIEFLAIIFLAFLGKHSLMCQQCSADIFRTYYGRVLKIWCQVLSRATLRDGFSIGIDGHSWGLLRPKPTSCNPRVVYGQVCDHLTKRKKAQSETLWFCLTIILADCITRLGLPFIETHFRNYTRAQSDHKAFPAKMVLASGGRCWSVATSRWFGAHQTKLRLHLGIWPVWPVWPVLFWLFYREIFLYNTHTVYCIYRVGNLRRPRRTSGPYVQNDLSLVITQSAPRKGQKTTNGPWLVRPRTMSICIFSY